MIQKVDTEILEILYYDGLSYEELASCFNCTITTIEMHKSTLKLKTKKICKWCKCKFIADNDSRIYCKSCGDELKILGSPKMMMRDMQNRFKELSVEGQKIIIDLLKSEGEKEILELLEGATPLS